MIASFFGKGRDSRKIFEKLKIGSNERFESHLNQHNVIYIAFNEIPDECKTYAQYIARIKQRILNDLQKVFPEADIDSDTAVWDAFNNIYEWEEDVQFIFVLDEWDYIFHRKYVTEDDKVA